MKLVAAIIATLVITCSAIAGNGVNYGSSTYKQAGNNLIVNRLGDQPSESRDGALGYNDFTPENAFKNNLKEQGYTVCYDTKPAGVDVVPVTYMGLRGDPRKEDVDYVLRSEYDALNASSQDARINANQAAIQNNETAISHNETRIRALESTQYKARLTLRLYDAKYFTVDSYGEYNVGRDKSDEFGINITLKLTKSYEEKRIDKLEAQVARMARNAAHKAIRGE